ncbi:MAG: transcriptional regulator [Planctomycetota bacterium]|nr:transcriptional regulator [Planctomycetota bacterium]
MHSTGARGIVPHAPTAGGHDSGAFGHVQSKRSPACPGSTPAVSDGGTRQALLDLLKRQGEQDVATLAQALEISNVAVRQHLNALEQSGLVIARLVRRPVGRPARLYQLTEKAEASFPQSNDLVALDLLGRLEKLMGQEALEQLFQARMKELFKSYKERLKDAQTLAEKVRILAQIREEEGYLAEAVAADPAQVKDGVKLIEHHCPVAAIAKRHPMVCQYEKELFKRVLGAPDLKRTEHIRYGGKACIYEVPVGTKEPKS